MSAARKMCLYKNCDKESGRTLFKFPTEKARFYTWSQCAGLELKGEINTDDPRYLCDKHFLPNYVSHQSRRKMLVHTAIPEKWKENLVIDEGEPKKFTVLSEKAPKSRKPSYPPRTSESDQTMNSPVLHNNRKRKYDSIEEIDQIEEYEEDQFLPNAESTEVIEEVYEEVTIPQPPKTNPVFIVVKAKKEAIPKKIMNYIRPAVTQKEGSSFFLTEEGNITASCNEDNKPEKFKTPEKKQRPSAPLENCTEFIFNGEIYVQMPKRVFDEERDRLKAAIEKYKDVLIDIRSKTDLIMDDNV